MNHTIIYPAGTTSACLYASEFLKSLGFTVTDHPMPEITHLLLDVPSFSSDGLLRNGSDLASLLSMLPSSICVAGGNLDHPALQPYSRKDLLRDPFYLSDNAAITAECAIRVASPYLTTTFSESPVLILGWGRIGKSLAMLLKSAGCSITVAARKAADRASIRTWGYRDTDYAEVASRLSNFRIIFNTVPAAILDRSSLDACRNCIKIELASTDGLLCSDVIIARGLPGKHAPESSGRLIANTFLRLWKEDQR